MSVDFERIREHEAAFAKIFPKRLVGELAITEQQFRDVLLDLREFFDLRRPPRLCPRLVTVAMVFTARFDYRGAFWRAFQKNLDVEEIDHTAWGDYFRKSLVGFGLFSPPKHWMVNVFPVLYHAIIPESSKPDFGVMVRSLMDAVDIRDLDDEALLAAVRSYDLPVSLRAFVNSAESAPVACDLIRQVAEDFRQLSAGEGERADDGTIRGALLASVVNASLTERKRFTFSDRLLVWRWDLGSSEIGAYLTGNVTFDDIPLRLKLAEESFDIESFRDHDGRWSISARLIPVALSRAESSGVIEFASGATERVRLARAGELPLFFRSTGNFGTLVGASNLEAGVYAIAAGDPVSVLLDDKEVQPLEFIPAPSVAGIRYAALYELSENALVQIAGRRFAVRGRMRAAATIAKISLWALLGGRGDRTPVYSESPRIRFESPQTGSSYKITDRTTNRVIAESTFENRESLRPEVPLGTSYRATVLVDGRTSGASAVDFALLPICSSSTTQRGVSGATGDGTLKLDSGDLQLSETPVVIAPDTLFSGEPLRYVYGGRDYRIQYIGPRPIMWRMAGGKFSRERLFCDMATVLERKTVEFRGAPGATIYLMAGNGVQIRDAVAADGRIEVNLSRFSGALEDARLDVDLVDFEERIPCVSIIGAPVAHYVGIGMESTPLHRFTIGGQVSLDRAVDRLLLVVQRYRQPWHPPQYVDLDGFARSWAIQCEPPPAEYVLTLLSEMDGRRIQVLQREGTWSKLVGRQYGDRNPLDAALYDALSGKDDAVQKLVSTASARILAIDRCTDILVSGSGEFESSIRRIFAGVGQRMTVRELEHLEKIVRTESHEIVRLAASSGLPIASAPQLLSRDTVPPPKSDLGAAIDYEFLRFLLGIARNADNARQAADVINSFADDETGDELKRAYTQLLRITLATDLIASLERLESEMEGPVILRARQEATQIVELVDLPLLPILRLNSVESLFAKCVSAILLFGFVSRLTSHLPAMTSVPRGSILLSRWLYDSALGPLSHSVLTRADQICAKLTNGVQSATC